MTHDTRFKELPFGFIVTRFIYEGFLEKNVVHVGSVSQKVSKQ